MGQSHSCILQRRCLPTEIDLLNGLLSEYQARRAICCISMIATRSVVCSHLSIKRRIEEGYQKSSIPAAACVLHLGSFHYGFDPVIVSVASQANSQLPTPNFYRQVLDSLK